MPDLVEAFPLFVGVLAFHQSTCLLQLRQTLYISCCACAALALALLKGNGQPHAGILAMSIRHVLECPSLRLVEDHNMAHVKS